MPQLEHGCERDKTSAQMTPTRVARNDIVPEYRNADGELLMCGDADYDGPYVFDKRIERGFGQAFDIAVGRVVQ